MKKLLVLIIPFLFGCATLPQQSPLVYPDYTYMNKDNSAGTVIVVPPSEIRTLREVVYINQTRLDKLELEVAKTKVTAETCLANQSIYNNQLQGLSNKVEDYRRTCEAMFGQILKK